MSFRVGGQDEERRGRELSRDIEGRESERRDGLEGTPMDEDIADDDDVEVVGDDIDGMQAMMGFGDFGSTKGKKVVGNNVSGTQKVKKTEYRQYMNRVGGFNRPLSPTR